MFSDKITKSKWDRAPTSATNKEHFGVLSGLRVRNHAITVRTITPPVRCGVLFTFFFHLFVWLWPVALALEATTTGQTGHGSLYLIFALQHYYYL